MGGSLRKWGEVPTLEETMNSALWEKFIPVLIAGFRPDLAGLSLGYSENSALKPRKVS